jgi:hypothetical protein
MLLSTAKQEVINEIETEIEYHKKRITELESTKVLINAIKSNGVASISMPKRFLGKRVSQAIRMVLEEKNGSITYGELYSILLRDGCDLGSRPERNVKFALGQAKGIKWDKASNLVTLQKRSA